MNPIQLQLQRVLAEAQELKRVEKKFPFLPEAIRFKIAKPFVLKRTQGVCYALQHTDSNMFDMLVQAWHGGIDANGESATCKYFPVHVPSKRYPTAEAQFFECSHWSGEQLDARIVLLQRSLRALPKLVQVHEMLDTWAVGNTDAWRELVHTRTCLGEMTTRKGMRALANYNGDIVDVLKAFDIPQQVIDAIALFWEACELGPECYPIYDKADSLTAPEQLEAYKGSLWIGQQGKLREHLVNRTFNMLRLWSAHNHYLTPRQPGQFVFHFDFEDYFDRLR